MAFAHPPDYSDEDMADSSNYPESSPDPLALSYNENKMRSKSRPTRKEPLAPSSANPQRRDSDITAHTLDFSSPSKSMVMNTGRTGGASPWRIKVTVEAEPGSGASDEENVGHGSPTRKRMTRTTTTTVPLKDPDASSPAKRRGRPRKSDGVTTTKAKRSGTPVRRRSRKSNIGAADTSIGAMSTDNVNEPPKRRRGRPRKSMQPEANLVEAQLVDSAQQCAEPEQASDQQAIAIDEAPNTEASSTEPLKDTSSRKRVVSPHAPLSENTPQSLGNIRSVRERIPTPARPNVAGPCTPSDSDEDSGEPTYDDLVDLSHIIAQDGVKHQAGTEVGDVAVSHDEDGHVRGEENTMVDGTTILESENFSMISVESLASRQALSSPLDLPSIRRDSVTRKGISPHESFLHPSSSQCYRNESDPRPSCNSTLAEIRSSPPKRQQTPAMDPESPSVPPAIKVPEISPQKASTPKLARVVKTGIALQGVLDATRLTPAGQSGQEALDEQTDRLEDLFRGFSDGTRRELRAGLRLGEQLARQSKSRHASKESSPTLPDSSKASSPPKDDPFSVPSDHKRRKGPQYPRLLTPEDQDDYALAPPPRAQSAAVDYPSLNLRMQQTQLISPARSDDEMSWRVDTPPTRQQPTRQAGSSHLELDARIQNARETVSRQIEDKSPIVVTEDGEQGMEDYSDIWEEEASRSSESPSDPQASRSPQLQDLFPSDGSLAKPARGKIPRTWRRNSSSDFNYSDEAEPEADPHQQMPQEPRLSMTESGKDRLAEPAIIEEYEDDEASEASDDTGMFWQQNLPAVFRKSNPEDLKSDKLDLSMLLGGNDSPMKDSSILHTPHKSSPFKNAPRFPALQTSPYKSSPLRQQFDPRDLESDQSCGNTNNSECAQSSPFRTNVDDTETSDIRQLRQEMEIPTSTESSEVRHLREEVEAHAFQPHNHTLHDIEEVTEHSRTEHQSTTMALPSSPPEVLVTNILAPKRAYPPLFGNDKHQASESPRQAASKPIVAVTPPVEHPKPQRPGLLGRLTSSIWGSLAPTASPPAHPITSKFDPLPRFEPWTKTHYKTLDALYQQYKRKPSVFAPSIPPNTNNALLESCPKYQNFVGAKFSSWGYSVVMSESYVVIAAVFMQLLQLKDIKEYEKVSGKKIQMGDCLPGKAGVEMDAQCVITRLATVIMGEDVRRDERHGYEIRRVGGMTIEWPDKRK